MTTKCKLFRVWKILSSPFRKSRAIRIRTIRRLSDAQIKNLCANAIGCGEFIDGDVIREMERRSLKK